MAFPTFTVTNTDIVSPRRAATLDRLQRRIEQLESRDVLTGAQQDRLERLQGRFDRLVPKDEFEIEWNGDATWDITIADSPWDDTIIGGESYKLRLTGTDYNPPNGWRRRFGSSMFTIDAVEGKVSELDNFLAWQSNWDGYYNKGYEDFFVSLVPAEQYPGPAVATFPIDYTPYL